MLPCPPLAPFWSLTFPSVPLSLPFACCSLAPAIVVLLSFTVLASSPLLLASTGWAWVAGAPAPEGTGKGNSCASLPRLLLSALVALLCTSCRSPGSAAREAYSDCRCYGITTGRGARASETLGCPVTSLAALWTGRRKWYKAGQESQRLPTCYSHSPCGVHVDRVLQAG